MAKMIRVKSTSTALSAHVFTEWLNPSHVTRVVDIANEDPCYWRDIRKIENCCEVYFINGYSIVVLESAESFSRRIERSLTGE